MCEVLATGDYLEDRTVLEFEEQLFRGQKNRSAPSEPKDKEAHSNQSVLASEQSPDTSSQTLIGSDNDVQDLEEEMVQEAIRRSQEAMMQKAIQRSMETEMFDSNGVTWYIGGRWCAVRPKWQPRTKLEFIEAIGNVFDDLFPQTVTRCIGEYAWNRNSSSRLHITCFGLHGVTKRKTVEYSEGSQMTIGMLKELVTNDLPEYTFLISGYNYTGRLLRDDDLVPHSWIQWRGSDLEMVVHSTLRFRIGARHFYNDDVYRNSPKF